MPGAQWVTPLCYEKNRQEVWTRIEKRSWVCNYYNYKIPLYMLSWNVFKVKYYLFKNVIDYCLLLSYNYISDNKLVQIAVFGTNI